MPETDLLEAQALEVWKALSLCYNRKAELRILEAALEAANTGQDAGQAARNQRAKEETWDKRAI